MKLLPAFVLALGLSASAVSDTVAAPLELAEEEMDGLTAASLIDVVLNIPITVHTAPVTINRLNVNVVVNIAVVIPAPGSNVRLVQNALLAIKRQ